MGYSVIHVKTDPVRSVSLCRAAGTGGVNAVCHSFTGTVTAVGSDVMSNPKVVPVYWGNTVLNDSNLKTAFDQFFCELLASEFVDRLSQYGVGVPTVLPSSMIAGTATSAGVGNVGQLLSDWFTAGEVSPPSSLSDANNWLYVVLAPPDASINSPGACGYHSNSQLTVNGTSINLAWAIIAFPGPAPGTPAVNVVNSVAYCMGHEMVEAFTDPRGKGYTVLVNATQPGDQSQWCEIGDICETKAGATVGRWDVETYWSNQDTKCAAGFGTDWTSLGVPGPGLLGAPVAGRNQDSRLEVFCVTQGGALWHIWQATPGGPWSSWSSLAPAAGLTAPPVAGSNQDGRIEVFAVQSGTLWHIWQTARNNGWSPGGLLGSPAGGIIGNVGVGNNQDGRLEVFGVGSDGQLYHVWQIAPNGGWTGWSSLGSPPPGILVGEPSVGSNADGRLEVFLQAKDGQIWHVWQLTPNGGWSSWSSLGGPSAAIANGGPIVGRNADGRLEIFVTGSDGNLYHMWQTAPNNGWSGWGPIAAQLTVPLHGLAQVASNQNGALQIFTTGSDGALWTIAQTAPNNGWSPWRFLDGAPRGQAMNGDRRPSAQVQSTGDLTVFVAGADGAVWTLVQTNPGGPWGGLTTS